MDKIERENLIEELFEPIIPKNKYWIYDKKTKSFIRIKSSKKYIWNKESHAKNAFSYAVWRIFRGVRLDNDDNNNLKFIENNSRYEIREIK